MPFADGYNPTRSLCGCSSVVERLLPKQDIVGSSPITRSEAEEPPASAFRYAILFVR